jgi:hypothetical protein
MTESSELTETAEALLCELIHGKYYAKHIRQIDDHIHVL